MTSERPFVLAFSHEEATALHDEIGVPCLDPECPHCPRLWAMVETLRLSASESELRTYARWAEESGVAWWRRTRRRG